MARDWVSEAEKHKQSAEVKRDIVVLDLESEVNQGPGFYSH